MAIKTLKQKEEQQKRFRLIQKMKRKELRETTFELNIQKFDRIAKEKGSLDGNYLITYRKYKAKVFSREMWLILTEAELPILGTTHPSFLHHKLFWKQGLFVRDYVRGYKKGKLFFDEKYKISKKKLYKIDARLWIRNLYHLCYIRGAFSSEYPKRTGGYIFYIQSYPFMLNSISIEEFGYYAGILNEIELFRNKHKELFKLYFNDSESKNHNNPTVHQSFVQYGN